MFWACLIHKEQDVPTVFYIDSVHKTYGAALQRARENPLIEWVMDIERRMVYFIPHSTPNDVSQPNDPQANGVENV